MSENKFKIGDEVILSSQYPYNLESYNIYLGAFGIIKDIEFEECQVQFDTFAVSFIVKESQLNLYAESTKIESNGGIKHDQQKAPMDLIPYESLEEIAKVLAAGEKKYGTANWAHGIEMRRLLSAAMRHLGQFNSGEDFDNETETLHLANAATNLLFAIWMYKNRPDLDNRWIKTIDKK